jgi:hypothetical protein
MFDWPEAAESLQLEAMGRSLMWLRACERSPVFHLVKYEPARSGLM